MSPITSGQGMAWRHNATFMFHTKRVCEVFAASRQQRSRERVAATRAAAFEELGIAEGSDLSEAQASAVGLRMMLDQIVSPESVTLDQLQAIHAKASDAADLLAVALAKVNGGASNARVVVRDFSKRSSRTRSTRQS